ncbi:hypothetical protein ACFYNY_29210 [Streptomyces sp. NPDC006530]|uniref:hypothetical protein n=1 Tax=Streptomyces sp. NPDC006530 TaxID=3364750 RepID=UPI00369A9499
MGELEANGILNALATLRAGRAFIELCEDEEFDPRDLARLIPLIQAAVKPRGPAHAG